MTFINISLRHVFSLLMIAAMLLSSSAAFAHAGEDHGDEAPATQSGQQITPRTQANSEDLEMLAKADGKALTIYLTHYKTNAPLTDVQVEIESGQNKAIAKPTSAGVYQAETPWLAQAGQHKLVVTVQGKDVADLLEATLDVGGTKKDAEAGQILHFAPAGVIASVSGAALLLVGMVLYGLSRRKKTKGA